MDSVDATIDDIMIVMLSVFGRIVNSSIYANIQ